MTTNRLIEYMRSMVERTESDDFDPTCVLCEFGEEPGHEH